LCPTMSSVTSTRAMRLPPLWTKNTQRRKSGRMTEARLWVLMTAGAVAPWKRALQGGREGGSSGARVSSSVWCCAKVGCCG
jgi:hypothetical protein